MIYFVVVLECAVWFDVSQEYRITELVLACQRQFDTHETRGIQGLLSSSVSQFSSSVSYQDLFALHCQVRLKFVIETSTDFTIPVLKQVVVTARWKALEVVTATFTWPKIPDL